MVTSSDLTIRPGNEADVEWAMALAPELASFGLPPWRDHDVFVDECRAAIRDGLLDDGTDREVLIASLGDAPVGLAHLLLAPDANSGGRNAVLNDLVVDPAHRGRGIGGVLLASCEDWARSRDAVGMVLAVFQDNVGARRLYERHGFRDDIVRVVRRFDAEPG